LGTLPVSGMTDEPPAERPHLNNGDNA
jgi:hypothetical protein